MPNRGPLPDRLRGPECDCGLDMELFCRRCGTWTCGSGSCTRVRRCWCPEGQQDLWSPTPPIVRQYTVFGRYLPENQWRPEAEWQTLHQQCQEATLRWRLQTARIGTDLDQLRRPHLGGAAEPGLEQLPRLAEQLCAVAAAIEEAGIACAMVT